MQVFIESENRTRDLKFKGRVSELLKKLEINSETVLVSANGELVTEEEELKDEDNVKLLSVISGG